MMFNVGFWNLFIMAAAWNLCSDFSFMIITNESLDSGIWNVVCSQITDFTPTFLWTVVNLFNIRNMATVRIFEVISGRMNVVRIWLEEIVHRHGSLNCIIINLYLLLNSRYRLMYMKKSGCRMFSEYVSLAFRNNAIAIECLSDD
jgi:hypothetical protein